MASFRQKRKGGRWTFRFVDESGTQRERKGGFDLVTTKGMARQAEERVARIKAGLESSEPQPVPPQTTFHQHLPTLVEQMRTKGCDPRHVGQTECYAARIIHRGGAEQVDDLNADRVLVALDSLRAKGLSSRTLNAHLTAIKTLAHSLVDRGFCARNPLAALRRHRYNEKADRRLVRRVLSEDEVTTLLQSTQTAPTGAASPTPIGPGSTS
jgi:hypothetical protein